MLDANHLESVQICVKPNKLENQYLFLHLEFKKRLEMLKYGNKYLH